jgi:hypothetical protein
MKQTISEQSAPQEIFEKIKKLMALSERGGTEAEALNAMDKVHLLLAKHNLSMSDLKQNIPVTYEEISNQASRDSWERPIYLGVAQLYFGKYFRNITENGSFHVVVAREGNSAIIHHIAQYLIHTAKFLSFESSLQHPLEPKRSHRFSFQQGFAIRIHQRCMEQMANARTHGLDATTGSALVIANHYDQEKKAIDEYLEKQNIQLCKAPQSRVSLRSINGFNAGMSAGDKADLGKRTLALTHKQ